MTRTAPHTTKEAMTKQLLLNPFLAIREIQRRSFLEFFIYFWDEISADKLHLNWHITKLCTELQELAERVGDNKEKEHDLIINIPPGTSKTSIVMIAFPVWCWTRWYWMRFIGASYSQQLSLESGEKSRDLIRSDRFKEIYPELEIKPDKDVKSNYRVILKKQVIRRSAARVFHGGNRLSTSVGGTVTGFHAHIILIDDPLNPNEAMSKVKLETANHWIDQVISTRKVDKDITPTVMIMQRLHQNDPSGHILAKKKLNVKHICLPGQLEGYEKFVQPPELADNYVNGLLDPFRLKQSALDELMQDLGQYGYAGQIGQNPTPPGGGMFKVDKFEITHTMPQPHQIDRVLRYWDKAGTKDDGAYSCGVKMARLKDGRFIVLHVKRGQWGTSEREENILRTARTDGKDISVWVEQEPGSGGKESAENTIRNLAGFKVFKELPKGDKVYRADPYSVQVNWGNVLLLYGDWNDDFIDEHRFFPLSKYKDQVDAAGAAFARLSNRKEARML